jgi:hypothetical protein
MCDHSRQRRPTTGAASGSSRRSVGPEQIPTQQIICTRRSLEPTCSVFVECDGRDIRTAQPRRGRLVMSKALVLGAAALVFSAASASAQVYPTPDYGYAEPVADLAVPADGYAAPAPPPAYAAPPVYAAPVYTAPQVYVVPAPVYAAPVVPAPVYTAPAVSRPIYAYAPGYWGGYGHVWHGYGHRWWR